jgi:hypothetical protein
MIRQASVFTLLQACLVFPFNPNLPLDRSYTLRNQGASLLAWDYAGMIARDRALGFIFPRPCKSPLGTAVACGSGRTLAYGSDTSDVYLGLGLLGAEEIRAGSGIVWSTEAGGILEGARGPASFSVDARMFSESRGEAGRPSYDRETFDNQNDSVTGSVSYRSYARYRGEVAIDLGFGRLSAGRNAVHWGPALLGNLAFHQDALPFEQFSFSTWLGPLSVITLYGDLAIGENQAYDRRNLEERNLYAHRYELRLGNDWLVGMSEQLILYGHSKPQLLAPIVPLFIAKGFMYEESNNGNLSFDAAYRLPGRGMVYGEFLLDDLESPGSLLIKDYIQNKWAATAGIHLVRDWAAAKSGLIVEFTRIEPWVYTHFTPGTSQAANGGYPLGNQQGPDARSVEAELYGRHPSGAGLSARLGYFGKGRGPGSGVDDAFPGNGLQGKGDFSERARFRWRFRPEASYLRKGLSLRAGGDFGDANGAWFRLAYVY